VHFPLYLPPEASTARKRRRQPAKTAALASPMAFSPRVPQTTLALFLHNQRWHDRRSGANTTKASALFFLLLCSHSSPPALINLSYASCWAIRTYVRSLGRGLRHHHHNIGDKKIFTRSKKSRALTELTENFLGRLDLKRTLSRRIRW